MAKVQKEFNDTINECAVGTVIKNGRIQKDMKQLELAELTGISNEQISRIEHGVLTPSLAYLKLIAPRISQPLDRLIELSGYMGGLDEEFVYTIVDGQHRIYLDTKGDSIDITKAALKIYEKDVVLFTLLSECIDSFSKTDIELFTLLLTAMKKKQEEKSNGKERNEIEKALTSMKVFITDFLKCIVKQMERL